MEAEPGAEVQLHAPSQYQVETPGQPRCTPQENVGRGGQDEEASRQLGDNEAFGGAGRVPGQNGQGHAQHRTQNTGAAGSSPQPQTANDGKEEQT